MSRSDWTWWDWDASSDVRTWDASVEGFLGYAPEALRGTLAAWWSRVHDADRERARIEVSRALAERDRWAVRYRVAHADGSWVAVVDRGSILRTGGDVRSAHGALIVDAPIASTERPENWAPLEREEDFRVFVDWLPQLAWSATPSGWLDWYNRRWYEYTGTTPEEMEGWGWISVHDPVDLPRILRIFRNAFRTGQPWEDEFRLRRAVDGELRWHLSRAMPLRDANGRIVRWFGTNTDIHDQRLAAEAYARMLLAEQELRREAQRASRAKDEFLAIVSHELRTPLTAILGWTQLMQMIPDAITDPERVREAIERIDRSARVQAKLVDDLLDLSRVMAQKLDLDLEATFLNALIGSAAETLLPRAVDKGVEVSVEPGEEARVLAHGARMQQVFTNLIDNAIKFTPAGGKVRLSTEVEESRVSVIVEDDGEGIAAELLPHIFDRFRQGDATSTRVHGGLGLGLAIAQEIVHAHGGEVFVESEGPGHGARFTVTLPVYDASDTPEAEGPAPSAPVHALTALNGVAVLLVDDEDSAREVVGAMLLAAGATVTRVASAREAIRVFRRGAPDVVVSDIAMPEEDGYALVARIRALADRDAAGTPCVALTAHASAEDRARALSLGFDTYVSKPVDAVRLTRAVGDAIRARYTDVAEADG